MSRTRSNSRQSKPVRTSDTAAQIHIPHSSWSRVEWPSRNKAAAIAPEDFWSRLGL